MQLDIKNDKDSNNNLMQSYSPTKMSKRYENGSAFKAERVLADETLPFSGIINQSVVLQYSSARNSSEGNHPKESRPHMSMMGSSVGSKLIGGANRSNSYKIEYIKQQDSAALEAINPGSQANELPKLDVILLNAPAD